MTKSDLATNDQAHNPCPAHDESFWCVKQLPNRFFRSESNLPVRHRQLHTAATCNHRIKSCGSLESLKDWTSDGQRHLLVSRRIVASPTKRHTEIGLVVANTDQHQVARSPKASG